MLFCLLLGPKRISPYSHVNPQKKEKSFLGRRAEGTNKLFNLAFDRTLHIKTDTELLTIQSSNMPQNAAKDSLSLDYSSSATFKRRDYKKKLFQVVMLLYLKKTCFRP